MPAPAVKKFAAFKEGLVPVESGNSTCARMGHAVDNRKHCRGPMEFLGEFCSDNANHAHMPIFTGNHNDRRDSIAIKRLDLFHRHSGDFSFFFFAERIPLFEFF